MVSVIKKLLIPSDENELEFVRIIKGKEKIYEYQFTWNETKKGKLMTITESDLEKNIRTGIFKSI